ncbi:hypothetical protein [Agromyces laixinhei]|uniref:hypothetical protein n=1 Tax=Agromyces laixinhei TaxID=2585717 RepID=UPI0012ED8ECE|nr:hypothetical protein [Agromyces laixinhei]
MAIAEDRDSHLIGMNTQRNSQTSFIPNVPADGWNLEPLLDIGELAAYPAA